MRAWADAAVSGRRAAVAALLVAAAVAGGAVLARGDVGAQTPAVPGKPVVSSVTAGDRQLTVNWSAASTPSGKPVVDYEVQYRAGSSGDWSAAAAATYSISFDSTVQTGSDATWAHDRDPLDLGTITGAAATYVERITGGRHNLPGIYRVKADVGAVRIRVDGDAGGAATIRAGYTTAPITDLRHNGTELARVTEAADASGFQLTGVTPSLPPNSYIWIDGWDHTSTNTTFPEFAAITVEERRLRIDVATVSTATSTTIADLTNQQSYQVRVRARNSAGWGAWSDASSGTPVGTPDKPTGVSLQSGGTQLIARWTAPVNNGGYAISDYDIQHRIKVGQGWGTWTDWQASTVSTATTTTITGLTNGTTYQVRVRATNSAGDGPWTDAVSDKAGKPSPPAFTLSTVRRPLPDGKYDRGGLLSITLDAEGHGSTVSDYDVRYREAGTATWYTFRDRSEDSGKLTTSEASGAADPIDFGTFTSPTGAVQVTRESVGTGNDAKAGVYKFSKAVDQLWIRASGTITGGGTVVARWHTAKPTAANLATAGTQIFSATTESDHTFWQDGWGVDLPANAYVWLHTSDTETLTKRRLQFDFTDNSAQPATSYDSGTLTTNETTHRGSNDPIDFGTFTTPTGGIAVTRENFGEGANAKAGLYKIGAAGHLWMRVSGRFSGASFGTVEACRSNTKPINLDGNCTQIFLVSHRLDGSFQREIWSYNLPKDSYIWFHTIQSGALTLTERRLELAFPGGAMVMSGLRNGATYELQARATNARGTGEWGSASGTAGAPMRPAVDTPVAKHQALGLTWAAPASDNASVVTGYDVRYRAGSSGAWSAWTHTTTARATTITGLTNDTEYEVQVRAKNDRGAGFWSASEQGTPAAQAPAAPAAPALASSGTTMTVTWTAPAANGAAITDYDVEYSSDSGTTWAPLLDTTFTSSKYTDSDYSEQATGNPIDLKAITGLPVTIAREQVGTTHWGAYKVEGALGALRVRVYGKVGQLDYVRIRYGSEKPASGSNLHATGTLLAEQQLTSGADFDISGTIELPPVGTYFWAFTSMNTEITERTVEVSASSISTATSASISGLTSGTAYQVRVRARNSVGTSAWSTASAHTVGRPSAPAAPALETGNAELTATWSAASGVAITDYDVAYCSSNCASDSSWTPLPDVTDSTALTVTITGLTNGTPYQVRVRAQNAAGEGPWSPTSSVMVGLPDAPSAPRVSPGDGSLTVNWNAPADNGSKLIDYDARYCSIDCESGNDALWHEHDALRNSTITHATFPNLTNGTEYYVQVRADNAHGAGEWSPWVKATPGTPATPAAPTLTAGDHKIIARWSAPADNGTDISDYDVRHCSANCASEASWTALPDTTASTERLAVLTDREVGTTYQVQVRAQNAIGTGAWSPSATLTLAMSPVPNRTLHACNPGGLTQLWTDYACYVKAGVNGIKAFNAVTLRSGDGDYLRKTDYPSVGLTELLAYNPNGGLAIAETSQDGVVQDVFLIDTIQFGIRSYELTGDLRVGQDAYLTVRLHSPDHRSPDKYMKDGSSYARSWVQLSLPTHLKGTDHARTGDVSDPIQVVGQYGDSVTFKLSAAAVGNYSITINAYRPAPDSDCPPSGDLRCFMPPVGSETQSYVAGPAMMANATFAAPPPPAAPTGLTATAGDGSVTLAWDDPGNVSITGYEYQVRWAGVAWGAWTAISGSGAATASHTFTGLENGKEYRYHLRAVNAGGSGATAPSASPWYVAATPAPPPPPPATPSSVSVTRADGALTASWPAATGATSYHVTYSSNGGWSWSLAAYDHPTTSITISDADNAKTYIVGVRAKNSGGGSGWRNSAPAGPFTPAPPPPATPPAAVASVTVTRADGTLTASWDAPTGATSYHVTYSDNGAQSWQLAALDHTTTSIEITADNALTYIIGVRAKNSAGGSQWRNSPSAGPYTPAPPLAPPATVASVTVTRADGTLTASWDAPTGATSYHVTYSDNGAQSWQLAALDHTTTSIEITADNALTYIIGVRAKNSAGGSGWRNSPPAGPFTP